jgi:indolepyruvate decarboxylase
MPNKTQKVKVSDYLIEKIQAASADHVFGVPGDFIISWMSQVEKSSLRLITTSDEQGAGFAADSYARLRGFGVVAVTYGVGGLKLANSTAQAYAEESPVLVISGAPGVKERHLHPMLHHKVKSYDSQLRVFQELTCAQATLTDPNTACSEIDRVINAIIKSNRPGYIELPRDIEGLEVDRPGPVTHTQNIGETHTDEAALEELLSDTTKLLHKAKKPIIVLGIQLVRFGLVEPIIRMAERLNIPIATTTLSKSAISEMHPNFIGVYAGRMSNQLVSDTVENSDCVMMLGVLMSDMDMGIYTAHIDPKKILHVTRERLAIGRHLFEHIQSHDFIDQLTKIELSPKEAGAFIPFSAMKKPFAGKDADKITNATLFARLGECLDESCAVIADPGDALFGGIDLPIKSSINFISSAFYASLGFAVPAAIGASFADPSLRPIVLVGDGAFQMTGMEISVAVRYGLNPIIIVLNNDGYLTERLILEGQYNDITPWNYAGITTMLNAGYSAKITTNKQFTEELLAAKSRTECFTLLEVILDRLDCSDALKRLGEQLNKIVKN